MKFSGVVLALAMMVGAASAFAPVNNRAMPRTIVQAQVSLSDGCKARACLPPRAAAGLPPPPAAPARHSARQARQPSPRSALPALLRG